MSIISGRFGLVSRSGPRADSSIGSNWKVFFGITAS